MSKRSGPGFLKRFGRACRGAVAVEFALMAIPFFSLLFAMLETTMVFFATVSLETGAAEAARMVRTGQAQFGGMGQGDMRNIVCGKMFMACDDRLQIDVRRFDNFTDVDFSDPLTADGDLRTDLTFDPGGAGDIVLVRVFYTWDVMTPLIGEAMSNMNGGARLIVASAAFRNEPFGNVPAGGAGGGGG